MFFVQDSSPSLKLNSHTHIMLPFILYSFCFPYKFGNIHLQSKHSDTENTFEKILQRKNIIFVAESISFWYKAVIVTKVICSLDHVSDLRHHSAARGISSQSQNLFPSLLLQINPLSAIAPPKKNEYKWFILIHWTEIGQQ